MNRRLSLLTIVLVLMAAAIACNLPAAGSQLTPTVELHCHHTDHTFINRDTGTIPDFHSNTRPAYQYSLTFPDCRIDSLRPGGICDGC